MKIYLVIRK